MYHFTLVLINIAITKYTCIFGRTNCLRSKFLRPPVEYSQVRQQIGIVLVISYNGESNAVNLHVSFFSEVSRWRQGGGVAGEWWLEER